MGEILRLKEHTLKTKPFHAGLAATVILQLASSLVMKGPRAGRPGDWLFNIHQYSGLTALGFAFGFFLLVALRRRGTETGLLFPWFKSGRRRALWKDLVLHARTLRSLRLPSYEPHGPFSSAVHGLGLLLMAAMAGTGTVFYIASLFGAQNNGFVRLGLETHQIMANLVWAYLIGHAGLAALHHYLQNLNLGEMWSLLPGNSSKGTLS